MVRNLHKHYRIELPEIMDIPDPDISQLHEVTRRSPRKLREEVERFAYYFKREAHTDFPPFAAHENRHENDDYRAYLFSYQPSYREPRVWAGAACFRWRRIEGCPQHVWALQWIWLHPYCRRQGLLSAAWPELEQKHGEFIIEGRLSPAMKEFLKSRGIDEWRGLKTQG
jgi:hypothetical protein